MNKKIFKNYIYNFISQILVLIVPLITTPYISRVLHEIGVGQYSYSLSIITYFSLFANLGFTIYGQREIAKVKDNKELMSKTFFEIFVIRSCTTICSLIVLFSILFTCGFGDKYNTLILILSLQVFSVIFDLSFLYQGIEDFQSIAIRTIIVRIVMIICIFLFVKTENDLSKYALYISLSQLLGILIMWPKLFKIVSIPHCKLEIKKHLRPAIMIFLPTLAVTIYSVFDKTMIGLLSKNPDYDNGCYEQAYKINSVALLLCTVIVPIFVSRNSVVYGDKNIEQLKNNISFVANYNWLIGVPLLYGFIALSHNLSAWFLGDGYSSAPLLMMIMSVRFIVSSFSELFGSQYFIICGKEKYVTLSAVFAAIINVLLNLVLIPFYGAIGAAIATALSELAITLIQGFFIYKEKVISLRSIFKMSINYIIAGTIMFIPIYFMGKMFPYNFLSFFIIALVGVLIYFFILLLLRDKFIIRSIKFFFSSFKRKEKNI